MVSRHLICSQKKQQIRQILFWEGVIVLKRTIKEKWRKVVVGGEPEDHHRLVEVKLHRRVVNGNIVCR